MWVESEGKMQNNLHVNLKNVSSVCICISINNSITAKQFVRGGLITSNTIHTFATFAESNLSLFSLKILH